ncbi:MAG TPA: hypothetical protein VLI90_10895 [Tepidisphaeraceae bacterium]|nr:hypothetical protein [Tepidisphaeraceae bacterium]
MSQTTLPDSDRSTAAAYRDEAPLSRRRRRTGIVVVLIVSLLASAGTRYWSDEKRAVAIPRRGETAQGSSLSSMNSFALGLLLGGLRGPLVMFLWTQSESQKADRNLEGIDTQIEWIRLLQPEFDTVHIFQIWNKAYNLSVQMASLTNKYSVILDALKYAHDVDREKPDDINIVTAIAQLYFDKLGGSTEKLYYRRRVRQETLPHATVVRPGGRPVALDPILDDQFDLLSQLTRPAPGRERPANLPADQEWNDGADIQYLSKYQPFPDGVSPLALAYNYYKRAEVLMNVGKQRHAQLSEVVIDSRPALALKGWVEEEWEQGRRRELQSYGIVPPEDRGELELNPAGFTLDHPIADRHAAELAAVAYERAARLVPDALAEYTRTISSNPMNLNNYQGHMDELRAEGELLAGDAASLRAQLSPPEARADLLAKAKQAYQHSIYLYELLLLRYYTDVNYLQQFAPPGYDRFHAADRKGFEDLSAGQMAQLVSNINHAMAARGDTHNEDRQEYERYMHRMAQRLQHMQ